MKQMLRINALKPQKSLLQQAAKVIQNGGLVAFPTETVYGLGANAFDAVAVRKIFAAKRRPADNPLIVHIAHREDVSLVAKKIPLVAQILMKAFWPGPLTLVLLKKSVVPDEVTAGSQTVAVRMPAHPVARELIMATGVPIAAPSANVAGRPSPTSAQHVLEDFGARIDVIVDGGKTRVGLESTVVDVTGKKVVILRSGEVTAEQLKKVLGYLPKTAQATKGTKVKSPGMKYKHYAPKVPMILVELSNQQKLVATIQKQISVLQKKGQRVGVLASKEHGVFYANAEEVIVCGSQENLPQVAKNLFATLRKFDPKKVDIIVAEGFSESGIGRAIMDRLKRAATKTIS